MVYSINGTDFTLQPTVGRWLPREEIGRDGNGHPIYPAVRQFEIAWVLTTQSEYNQIQTFFSSVITTGTAVVELPQYGAASYTFYRYSGCVLSEPELAEYFNEHSRDVRLLVSRIRT